MLIGLTGLAGSGKSEVARVLIEEFGFQRIKFADGLKNMTRSLFRDMGHCADDVERMIEGDLKDVTDPELGVTPRHIMVTLGTEWGRDNIHADLWARIWSARIATLGPEANIVADDVRFPNEVRAVHYHGGHFVRVTRPGLVSSGHKSEQLDAKADWTIENTGTLADLRLRAAVLHSLCA